MIRLTIEDLYTMTTDEKRVFRYDRGLLNASFRTDEGYLLCEGIIAKPGVLIYRKMDGSTVRELIPEDELTRSDSLSTLGRKPVTLEHPSENVSPSNVGDLGVGDVDSEIEVMANGFVKIKMAVRRVDAIKSIEDGETTELSPGYSCRIDPTPGTHPIYGPYDAIQRDRRYNHAALTVAARGGPDIRLRADSAIAVNLLDLPTSGETMDPKLLADLLGKLGVERADAEEGEKEELKPEDMIKMIEDAFGKLTEQRDGFQGQANEMQSKMDELLAKMKGEPEKEDGILWEGKEEAKKDEEMVEEEPEEAEPGEMKEDEEEMVEKADSVDPLAFFNARLPLVELAKEHKLDAAEVAKMDNNQLRKAIVLASNPKARKDAEGAYYEAAIDFIGLGKVDVDAYRGETTSTRRDSVDIIPSGIAFLKSVKREA